jgi:hypothetical protein
LANSGLEIDRLLEELDALSHTLAAGDALVGDCLVSPIREAELMELAAVSHRAWLTLAVLTSDADQGQPSREIASEVAQAVALAASEAVRREHKEWARALRNRLKNDVNRSE